jgi:hypothetical protein
MRLYTFLMLRPIGYIVEVVGETDDEHYGYEKTEQG